MWCFQGQISRGTNSRHHSGIGPLPSTSLCGDRPLPKVWSFHGSTDVFCVRGAGFLTESVQCCGWAHTRHRSFNLVDSVLGPNKKGCHVVMCSLFSPTNPLCEEVVRQEGTFQGSTRFLEDLEPVWIACADLLVNIKFVLIHISPHHQHSVRCFFSFDHGPVEESQLDSKLIVSSSHRAEVSWFLK